MGMHAVVRTQRGEKLMKHTILVPLILLAAVALASGCSSSESSSPGDTASKDARRVAIGKADLLGSCQSGGQPICGGKAPHGNCHCDAACVSFGDCCADAAGVCGIGGGECTDNKQCPSGQYCASTHGCATPGNCKPIPIVACAQVVTEYCDCKGVTQTASSGCIWDRYDHLGKCAQTQCGGIANLPCASGEICVDDPSDTCDPDNGGTDCSGVCQPKIGCGGIAGIPCGPNEICVDDPADSCDPNNGGADCGGVCVAKPSCGQVMCALACPAGFKKAANGCPICECEAADSCSGFCGGKSGDGSCFCDKDCLKFGDCCGDYQAMCTEARTPASGQCIKNSNDTCTTDADCVSGGCGGELCFNPAGGTGFSSCECAGPGAGAAGCGCVQGKCSWFQ